MNGLQELQLLGCRTQTQELWHTGLAALQHVGSSRIRDRTRVSCMTGRFFTTEPQGKSKDLVECLEIMLKG